MSRRLEIELTSKRDDGMWTWRAAGARRPKGDVSAALLPESASVGSILRVEAEGGLDGLEIITVLTPRERDRPGDRLELISTRSEPPVTTSLVKGRGRSRSDFDDDRRGSGRRPKPDRDGGRDGRERHKRPRREGGETKGDDRDRSDRRRKPRSDDRSPRETGRTGERGRRDDRNDRGTRGDRDRAPRRDRTTRGDSPSTGRDGRSGDSRPPTPPRPRTPALKAKRVHRQAILKTLPAEQQPLAREVLRGGVPGVRQSIEQMNAKAAAEKMPQIKSEPLIALAESLAPVLKAAEWHDRADAALAGIAEIDLRDIRSVVAAADRAARTDETRALAESLRSGLSQRLEADHRKWLDELANTIHEGRTVRALRLSSRPPKAGAPLPPDMAERLASIAAADLNPTANQQRWATVVDSVALSPVRTQVVPAGMPEKPTDDLLSAIRRVADRVPQIAALFGVSPAPARRGGRRPPPPPAAPQPTTDEQAEATTLVEATAQAEPQSETSTGDQAEATPSADAGETEASEQTEAEEQPEATDQAEASEQTEAEEQPEATAETEASEQTEAEEQPEATAETEASEQTEAEEQPEATAETEASEQTEAEEQPEATAETEASEQTEAEEQPEATDQAEASEQAEPQAESETATG